MYLLLLAVEELGDALPAYRCRIELGLADWQSSSGFLQGVRDFSRREGTRTIYI